MKNPVLRSKVLPGCGRNGADLIVFQAVGGLHHIRGNGAPYFSLTLEATDEGGCNHEKLTAEWPELADLAALHLSDIDGVPMHAEGNGWYFLAGALPEFGGQCYHVGNTERNFPKPAGAPRKARTFTRSPIRRYAAC